MQNRRDLEDARTNPTHHPLKSLTPAQFMALGGSAVAFVRTLKGEDLSRILSESNFEDIVEYHLVMSADGTPLMVSDSEEAVSDWLADQNVGLVSVH